MRQYQALLAAPGTDHVQRRLAAGAIKGAPENLAIDRHNALNAVRKLRHEPLKHGAELRRIEQPEQPAEGVVTGDALLQLEEAAQERLFRFGKPGHFHRALTTAKDSAQRDHQKLMEVVQTGIPGSRVRQPLPAADKLFQGVLPTACFARRRVQEEMLER